MIKINDIDYKIIKRIGDEQWFVRPEVCLCKDANGKMIVFEKAIKTESSFSYNSRQMNSGARFAFVSNETANLIAQSNLDTYQNLNWIDLDHFLIM